MSEKKIPRCYTCHEIVTFNDRMVGKNGRKIPLDPETLTAHQCKAADKPEITETEASHAEPQIIEGQEPKQNQNQNQKQNYPQHRIRIVYDSVGVEQLQDRVNGVLAENDAAGYNHKGVTFTVQGQYAYAMIHYEILQPRTERGFNK